MTEIDVSKCPACHNYNVFGVTDKPCCYHYHKYCDEVSDCNFKNAYKQLQQLKAMIEKIKEHCNETARVMGDTGNNPYSQGRTIEAKRVLEILGEDKVGIDEHK